MGISASLTAALVASGMGEATAGIVAAGLIDAGIGAGVGALGGAVTGGDIGMGALGGALTGGAIGAAGPALGGALGSATAGGALAGAAGGALGGVATGGNILTSTLGGAASGALAGSLSPDAPTTGTAGQAGGNINPISGGSSGTPAAPAGIGGAPGGDVTFADASQFGGSTPVPPASGGFSSGDLGGGLSSTPASALSGSGSFGSGGNISGGVGGENISGAGGSISGGSGGGISGGGGNNISGAATGTSGANLKAGNVNPVSGGAESPSSISTAFKDPSVSNIGKALGNNAGLLTTGAGLVNDLTHTGPVLGSDELKSNADQLQKLGTSNANYLQTGTLPPGVQGGIDQATKSAIAAVRSKYASMGMSGSSAEMQDIASIQSNAHAQGAQIAMQLMNSGASELGLSSEIYQHLISNTMASDQNFSSAFTNLASAVGGRG